MPSAPPRVWWELRVPVCFFGTGPALAVWWEPWLGQSKGHTLAVSFSGNRPSDSSSSCVCPPANAPPTPFPPPPPRPTPSFQHTLYQTKPPHHQNYSLPQCRAIFCSGDERGKCHKENVGRASISAPLNTADWLFSSLYLHSSSIIARYVTSI